MSAMTDPATPAESQDAVNLAEACVLLDSARQYGLITGGPVVDVDRCVAILAAGSSQGIVPVQSEVDRIIEEFARGDVGARSK